MKTLSIVDLLYRIVSVTELGLCIWLLNYAYDHLNELQWWKTAAIAIFGICQIYASGYAIINGPDDKTTEN